MKAPPLLLLLLVAGFARCVPRERQVGEDAKTSLKNLPDGGDGGSYGPLSQFEPLTRRDAEGHEVVKRGKVGQFLDVLRNKTRGAEGSRGRSDTEYYSDSDDDDETRPLLPSSRVGKRKKNNRYPGGRDFTKRGFFSKLKTKFKRKKNPAKSREGQSFFSKLKNKFRRKNKYERLRDSSESDDHDWHDNAIYEPPRRDYDDDDDDDDDGHAHSNEGMYDDDGDGDDGYDDASDDRAPLLPLKRSNAFRRRSRRDVEGHKVIKRDTESDTEYSDSDSDDETRPLLRSSRRKKKGKKTSTSAKQNRTSRRRNFKKGFIPKGKKPAKSSKDGDDGQNVETPTLWREY